MKRLILLIVTLMTVAGIAAQPRLRQPEMYFGVQGGIMASTVAFYPKIEQITPLTKTVLLSPTGGFVFRYNGQKYCGVQVEVNYIQRGWKEKGTQLVAGTTTEYSIDYTRKLHYIEVPFLMHLYFGSPQWRFIINAGPQIGYCVYDDEGRGDKHQTQTHQYDPITNRFDWGVAGGLGVCCRTKNSGLYQLEARFSYSFGTLFANRTTDYFGQSNPMNLSICLAWMWEFKRKNKQQQ